MTNWKYSTTVEQPHARAVAQALDVSNKHTIMLCSYLRGRSLQQAKRLLAGTIALKQAVPLIRFYRNQGHKVGIGAGHFPQKAAGYLLKLLDSAESNAEAKGLSTQDLYIAHLSSKTGSTHWKPGRQGRRRTKSSHIEVILMEGTPKRGSTSKKESTHKSKTTAGKGKTESVKTPKAGEKQ